MEASPTSKMPFLPTEIWLKIIKLLHWDSPSSVKAVALVSRRLRETAAPLLFKYFRLTYKLFPKKWEHYSDVPWRYVKVIVVTGDYEYSSPGGWVANGLLKMIESTECLQEFFWKSKCYMPGFILYSLNRLRPHVSVHITGHNVCISQRRRPHQPAEASLFHLRSLRYLSSYWDFTEWDEVSKTRTKSSYQARLKDIICASPNLETLKLFHPGKITTTDRGIISLQKGDTLPQLKHLHLSNMYFDASQSFLWAEALQWELLHSLSLLNGNWTDLAPLINGRLKNLRSLEISISRSDPQLTDWRVKKSSQPPPIYWQRATQINLLLQSFSSLETFSGYHLSEYILDTLSHHHAELRHLRFRAANRQRSSRAQLPFPPSIGDVLSLSNRFPKLESLGIDLDWEDEEWPFDIMAHIRNMTNLKHLEINIPGVDPEHTKRTPAPSHIDSIDESACLRLLQSFESDTGYKPLFLRSIHVKMGEWESDKWDPGAFYHTTGPLLIGERDLSGKMRFSRFAPRVRRSDRFRTRMNFPPKDDYRITLELYSLDSPFVRDSGTFAYVPYNSEWAAGA